ncbi:MAG: RNA polymerase sigma factor [Pedosphaera sp.]|nr:RNA polymerase sigma factor [Pedosphaera sp.]
MPTLETAVEETMSDPPAATAVPTSLESEFAILYEKHHRQIFYLALRLLGDPGQAEDATHDVFIKAYRKIGEFRGDADVRTWLYRITLNHCSNLRQSWHARNVHVQADDTVFELAVGTSENPLRMLEISELGERIRKTLEGMPDEYRVLLLLVADDELSYNEIAELTKQSADAVRGKLHRARKAFTMAFQKTG